MGKLVRRDGDLFAPIQRLQDEMNKVFRNFFQDPFSDAIFQRSLSRDWMPKMDLEEREKDYLIEVEVPGVDPKDVEIKVKGNTLVIKGETDTRTERKEREMHVMERSYGSFQRVIPMPEDADLDMVKATGKNGVLTITVGKKPAAEGKVRTIQVDVE